MHLLPLLSLLSVALAAPSPLQQLPFLSPSSSASFNLPASESLLSSSIESKLAQLPLDHLSQLQEHISQWTEPRRIRLRAQDGSGGSIVDLTEGQKALLSLVGLRYIDITNEDDSHVVLTKPSTPYPSHLAHNASSLSPLFESISLPSIKDFLKTFTGFRTRYYRSQTGRDSQLFLLNHLKELHSSLNSKAKITFREFQHEWIQKSIIVRWEPTIKTQDYKDEVVILSAHQVSPRILFPDF